MHERRKITRIIIIAAALIIITKDSFGLTDSTIYRIGLDYSKYIEMVMNHNLEYLAEKYNTDIAQSNIKAARISYDPVLSFERSGIYEDQSSAGYSLSTEISRTFDMGGKRRSRIDLATAESVMSNALLDEYQLNLLTESTIDYLTAMKADYLYMVKQDSYLKMKELADADSIRLSLGSIMSIDAAQSRIEAGILQNELLQADASRINSFLSLSVRTSSSSSDTLYMPTGRFEGFIRDYELGALLDSALLNRPDLKVAKANVSFYNKFLSLTKSQRGLEIDLHIGASGLYLDDRIVSPSSHEIYAGVSVPLKFSNLNKGDLQSAGYQIMQKELLSKQLEVKIRNEVIQAFNQYISLCQQVVNYEKGLLKNAGEVLNGKIYSYSRGESSLLEVLNAQRTYNDVQTSYIETMYDCFTSLIELRRAVGNSRIDPVTKPST